MLLKEINDIVIDAIPSLDKNDENVRLKTIHYVNFSIDELWRSTNWEFRKGYGQLTLIPQYSTGTCAITKYDGANETAARTVTLSTPLPYQVRGQFFIPKNSSSAYRIISGNAGSSTIILDAPVIDNSNGSSEFIIWKKFYLLPSNVDVVVRIDSIGDSGKLNFNPSSKVGSRKIISNETGIPTEYSVFGVDEYDDVSYETGTINISENSNTVTGSGTSFIGNVFAGDILTVNSKSYSIKRVESNTYLILNNYAVIDAFNSNFKIKKNNPYKIEFVNPSQSYKTLNFEYLSKSYDLINEYYDSLNLNRDYVEAIVLNAQAMWLEHKDYNKFIQKVNLYQSKLNGLKIKRRAVNPAFRQFEPKINPIAPGRM